jgi:anti-anti-sigma regulatory factor
MTDTSQISVVRNDGDIAVIGGGMLDITNCDEFSRELKHASQIAENLTVDLRQADFIDTQIVHDLAKAAMTMLNRGKRLKVLAAEEKYPLEVLRISTFEQIMDIEVR